MSYHVSILRTTGGRLVPVTREEVTEAVEASGELKLHQRKGESLEITTAEDKPGGPLLIWENGEIWTKNPDEKTLQLMLNLAQRLKARVRGDEFETYETPKKTYLHPEDKRTADNVKRMAADMFEKRVDGNGLYTWASLEHLYCSAYS